MSVPLEDLALLSDLEAAGLISREGDLVWLCLPRFDSAAMCSSLLGDSRHGHWSLRPADRQATPTRAYVEDSLVLETVWNCGDGQVRVLDLMPTERGANPDVVRLVEGVRGRVALSSVLSPRFGYGEVRPWMRRSAGGAVAISGPDSLHLRTDAPLAIDDATLTSDFSVGPGEQAAFVLTWQASHLPAPAPVDGRRALRDTLQFWAEWHARTRYQGRYAEDVRRSLTVVKALTYAPTGGIVAAATTSLPESLGGSRNWDYRYCWLRDATLALRGLVDTGHHEDAQAWRDWLLRAASGDPDNLQVIYGPAGERSIPEWEADWLPGYEGSVPVRVGNAARGQFQLDVYGEVVTALHHSRAAGLVGDPAGATWDLQQNLVEHIAAVWDRPDQGIWETRGDPAHFVHSKVLAWAALDRAAADAEQLGLTGVPVARWREIRDRIHTDVLSLGFNERRNSFVREYGSADLDGALLRIPLVGFLPWDDPRVKGTVDAVAEELGDGSGLIRRYLADDTLPGEEGAFLACSFWLAQCRAHLGQLDEARESFDLLLGLRNDLGLLAEQYDVKQGRMVGNFPQAFSHVPLVVTALTLDQLSNRPAGDWGS